MGGSDAGIVGEPSATIRSTTSTLVANLVGAGLLSLPFTIKRAGIIPGLIAMVVVCVVNALSALLIARCCELSGKYTYKDMAVAALGKRAGIAIAATLVLYTLGSCVAFAVLLGDFLPNLFDFFMDMGCGAGGCTGSAETVRSIFGRAEVMIVLVGSLVLNPLALNRNLDALRFTSGLSFICIIYTFFMLVGLCGAGPRADTSTLNVSGGGPGLFVAFPILLVSLTAHYNVPKLYVELKERSMARLGAVVAASFSIVLVVYLGAAICGYLLKGSATQGDILNSFDETSPPIVVARIALSLVVIGCFPLAFNSLRIAAVSLLPPRWAERIKEPHYEGSGAYAAVPHHDAAVPVKYSVPVDAGATAAEDGLVATTELSLNRGLLRRTPAGSATSAVGGSAVSHTGPAGGSVTYAATTGAATAGEEGYALSLSPAARIAAERCSVVRVKHFQCTCPTPRALCMRLKADWPHVVVTKLLVLVAITIAILVPSIETVLGYKGAIGGSLVVLIFPVWMFFGLTQRSIAAAAAGVAGTGAPGAVAVKEWAAASGEGYHEGGSVPLAAELHWQWVDLVRTRHGLLASVFTVIGMMLMVSGTLAASGAI
jgi:amino acid permease